MRVCDASKTAARCKAAASRDCRWWRKTYTTLAHRLAGAKLVLVGNDYVIAFCEATNCLCKIQSAKPHAHRPRMHNSAVHNQCLIDQKGARRHQQGILVDAGDDV